MTQYSIFTIVSGVFSVSLCQIRAHIRKATSEIRSRTLQDFYSNELKMNTVLYIYVGAMLAFLFLFILTLVVSKRGLVLDDIFAD